MHSEQGWKCKIVIFHLINRKDQNNKGMVHNVIVRGNDSMRQQANLLEDGSIVFILGILHTQFVRNERGNMQGTYLIRPRQLIIRQ